MDNYNALRVIAKIADEVFSVGGSQVDALEKIRVTALESLNLHTDSDVCNCSEPAPIGVVFKCRQCQLPISRINS